MRNLIIALLILLTNISLAQTIEELEYELSYYKSREKWGNKKGQAYQLLELDGLNVNAINYLVEVYGRNNQQDSIGILFDKIIKEHPQNPDPYLIRVSYRNPFFEKLTFEEQIDYLQRALEFDSTKTQTLYLLGKKHYEAFNQGVENKTKVSSLNGHAERSIEYFEKLCLADPHFQETLRYPLIQLSNFLDLSEKVEQFKRFQFQSSYFPISALAELPNDWETNYDIDVIWEIESAIFRLNWYSSHLSAMDEPVLTDSLPTKIYRFTWLRSFHNPIVIGLENSNDTITLYWKVTNGAGGYEPGEIVKNNSKKITIKEWRDITSNIDSVDFWNLSSTNSGFPGTDGAQWLLEGKELGRYHMVDRWSGGEIGRACLELLKLTNLSIKEDEIY